MLKRILVLLIFVLGLILGMVGGIFGAVISAICVFWACSRIRKTAVEKEQELSGDFRDYAGAYNGLTQAELTKILLQNEIDRTFPESAPVAWNSVLWRGWLTLIYLVANFLCINNLYYTNACSTVCSLLTVAYVYLFCRFSTLWTLYRYAKKNPTTDFGTIVREKCTEEAAQKAKSLGLVGIGLMVVSLAGFGFLHRTPSWTFSNTGDGYCVSQYRPAVLDQSQVQIPAEYENRPVVAIGDRAFANLSELETVTMPDTVRSIGKQAFADCDSLTEIRLSETLTYIGSGAFKECSSLTGITLPDTLTELLGEAFMDCSELQSITIPESVTEIRGNCFDGCSQLNKVVLHNGIVDIHAYAFRDCEALKQITLPEGITEIHTYTFKGCESLKEIDIPQGVTRIAAHAFDGCTSLTDVFLPDSLLEIRSSAFRNCSKLQTIRVPKGVTIDERAFKESPTKIVYKSVSDAVMEQIVDEIDNKEPTDVYYYIYDITDPSTIHTWGEDKFVLILDDQKFRELLGADEALKQLNGTEELMIYLNAAKKAGLTNVKYGVYSQVGSDATGKPYFASIDYTIEEMIEMCVKELTESENE